MVDRDYEELFSTLNFYKIKYLVVGAHAVMYYTEPRFTKDLDVWIPVALNDAQDVYDALRTFGAPLKGIQPHDFTNPKMILQIGVAPVRIDILTALSGVDIADAWRHRVRSRYGRTRIHILGRSELIRSKQRANRPEDRFDLTRLRSRSISRKRK